MLSDNLLNKSRQGLNFVLSKKILRHDKDGSNCTCFVHMIDLEAALWWAIWHATTVIFHHLLFPIISTHIAVTGLRITTYLKWNEKGLVSSYYYKHRKSFQIKIQKNCSYLYSTDTTIPLHLTLTTPHISAGPP